MYFFDDIVALTLNNETCILDARTKNRFKGIDPEPREGLRSGQILNSKNLPFSELLTQGKLKSKEELQQIFKDLISNKKDIVFSCGSGITACILALGADVVGLENLTVYDGSWTEYGSLILDE